MINQSPVYPIFMVKDMAQTGHFVKIEMTGATFSADWGYSFESRIAGRVILQDGHAVLEFAGLTYHFEKTFLSHFIILEEHP